MAFPLPAYGQNVSLHTVDMDIQYVDHIYEIKNVIYIYIYPSSPRSILFIDIRYTYIHSHMSLCHALSRPTTYTYQLKHVKTTACAHGHIPT